ncbi:glycine betaine ABC transporter substrate-binding protein [Pseudomonas sp. DTU_2021_1001937_2_SI_NGA_ILE_001]|uniref:glycine betaine ABC transporter substrate-binding protein n=1 Tax=Pseudomonas sp. DTU_2021_1001937_2_SI_NGA_ILE_001 TaxID=3077589 RepID=UPI0028FC1C60|nr:glycine betaine ABC transporter substrate-binding protein [Pseudomonas sp. DTU_2021_1001937_2_SI_NGA_ILE_001]WNW12761.1 glycine betaine ABC transporter substrate-binding protein [Pseudomonas sp. DTU_2021_1001937_2_SI_NGA_ILE_001]
MPKVIRLGHIDLSFHAASAALVHRVLERYGYEVEVRAAPHEAMFKLFGERQIDLLVSAWLPASHGAYLAACEVPYTCLTVLYQPYCIWGVPDYISVEDVASVADLLKRDVAALMNRRIQGINPGAGISRFSKAMVRAYGLDSLGYYFADGTEADCFNRFEASYARNEWFVVPLWHPQYLHHSYSIRALDEPLGLLGGTDEATLIATREQVQSMPEPLLAELAALRPGNAAISEIDFLIHRAKRSALEAADHWLELRCNEGSKGERRS